jgi:IclR family pca regulon transcriptional regulator
VAPSSSDPVPVRSQPRSVRKTTPPPGIPIPIAATRNLPVKTAIAAKTEAAHSKSAADNIDTYTGDPNFMTSLARGLMVIEAFSSQSPQMTISQVSAKTGLSRAAVRRCLYTLSKLGFVGCDDGQRFTLRARILSLSHAFTRSSTLAHAAQPLLDRLSHSLNESCSVATFDGEEIVYIARASVARIMAVDLTVGSRLPAYCTSIGRVMLAHQPQPDLDLYLSRVKLHRYTARTINSTEKLRQVLKNVERFGYALVDQELEIGLRSLAVPVRSPSGKVIAAINVGAQAQRMPIPDLQTRYLQHLVEASRELTMMLR